MELKFACTECDRVLGRIDKHAGREELDHFCESLRAQGFTPVHHWGWFCSQACGEAFFRRQLTGGSPDAEPRDAADGGGM